MFNPLGMNVTYETIPTTGVQIVRLPAMGWRLTAVTDDFGTLTENNPVSALYSMNDGFAVA